MSTTCSWKQTERFTPAHPPRCNPPVNFQITKQQRLNLSRQTVDSGEGSKAAGVPHSLLSLSMTVCANVRTPIVRIKQGFWAVAAAIAGILHHRHQPANQPGSQGSATSGSSHILQKQPRPSYIDIDTDMQCARQTRMAAAACLSWLVGSADWLHLLVLTCNRRLGDLLQITRSTQSVSEQAAARSLARFGSKHERARMAAA